MSTRSNKAIGLLLVEPLDLERVIHTSKRAVDTLQAAIGSVEIQASIDVTRRRSTLFIRRPTPLVWRQRRWKCSYLRSMRMGC
ncbi:hypothetical protein F2Q68_00039548 [Brassica cretica]|uniref:Uncharacterized protein n=1 Tax=Brassica cretica TaxID=69181 RepID=A0A8S9MT05_BRACR|nr:hypothetical protein F2Q68_00039548 [Brassica cretica]